MNVLNNEGGIWNSNLPSTKKLGIVHNITLMFIILSIENCVIIHDYELCK